MCLDVLGNGFSANFFFTFENDLDIDGQLAIVRFEQRLEGLHLHPELTFVINRTASVDVVIALCGLEWRADPLVERLGGLDIVMGIAKGSRLTGCVEPIAVDQRISS